MRFICYEILNARAILAVWNFDACAILWQVSQPAITCSKLTIEILEQGVANVQS